MKLARNRRTFALGHCTAGNHLHCPGALNLPDIKPSNLPDAPEPGPRDPHLCACPCHEGKEVTAPARQIPRPIIHGKRDTRLLEQWGDTLLKQGMLEVDAPEDKKELNCVRTRVHTAAKRKGMKVQVRTRDGQLIATVRRPI